MTETAPRPFAELQDCVPDFAAAIRCHDSGDLDGAQQLYRNLVDQPHLMAPCLHQLGLIAAAQGDPARAADLFLRVTRLDATLWSAYRHLSAALDLIGHRDAATNALIDLGCQLYTCKEFSQAEPVFLQALAREPANYLANANLGSCLALLGRWDEAAALMIRALRGYGRSVPDIAAFVAALEPYLDPAFLARIDPLPEGVASGRGERVADVLTSLGKVMSDLERPAAALLCYHRAVQTAPGFALAHWNYALSLLGRRDFAKGWAEYEWRWQWPEFPEPSRSLMALPWRGEPLAGKRILIWAEQGFGDVLQFVPLVQWLKDRNPEAEVLLEVPVPLIRLLANSLQGIQVIRRPDLLEDVATDQPLDYALPLMSLPYRLQLTPQALPMAVKYLHPAPESVAPMRRNFAGSTRPRIGLVWASRPFPDLRRSVPLGLFAPLIAKSGACWYALQVGEREADLARENIAGLKNLAPHLIDFADTAAALDELDLVITVDTAVAHLAGGMGKDVWTLLPAAAEWRWADERDTTRWYPSMRLFRQDQAGDWATVVQRLAGALKDRLQQAA